MTDVEATTRRLAAESGVAYGSDPVDGSDEVSIDAGWMTHRCADVVDAGGGLVEMRANLAEALEGWSSPGQQKLGEGLAKLCSEIAGSHPDAPGDAIRDAFGWTGWCHPGNHGSATVVTARLSGADAVDADRRRVIAETYLRVLLLELVTPEAVHEAWKAGRAGGDTYWARRWKSVRERAAAAAGIPPQAHIRLDFTHDPW